MCMTSTDATPAPSAGASYSSMLRAQTRLAPDIYAMNAAYSPLYTQLAQTNLNSFLNGSGGQPGFLSEYSNQIMPQLTAAQTAANSATRTANLNDAAQLTPQYIAEERAANPGAAGLLDTMTSNSARDLSYGTNLTPAEQTQFNQSQRSGAAARGLGFGPSDVFNESLANTGFGQSLYNQRMGQAQGMASQLQSFYGNPTAAISGMASNAGMSSGQMAGFGSGNTAASQSNEFNPINQLSSDWMNNQNQVNLSNAQGQNQMTQAGGGGMEKMGGSMMGTM